jgi:alkaline phosphatase D
MRIAFTSCFSTAVFPQQPIWSDIAASNPDVLVLLGDSMYLDCGNAMTTSRVQEMSEHEFAQHAYAQYQEQLRQPDFSALIARRGLRTYAIWDDHDFLWNDACGADVMKNPAQRPLVYVSRAMFAAYRAALAGTPLPAALPAWGPATPAPGYQHVPLGEGVHLHLTDGRSSRRRGGKVFLGKDQLDAIEAAMQAAGPGASHLLASPTVVERGGAESWLKCKPEYDRLLDLAKRHNILVLSGDVHDFNVVSYPVGNRQLHEATASGAAIRRAVTVGSEQRNWGLLEIDAGNIGVTMFEWGESRLPCRIDRQSWVRTSS